METWNIFGKDGRDGKKFSRASPLRRQGMKRARQFLALEPLDDEVNQCQAEDIGPQDLPGKHLGRRGKGMESAWLQMVSNFKKPLLTQYS